jgi:short-subunit dehydrogenase
MVVTGASSGIGRALALRAAAAGYAVLAVGRNRQALDALAGLIHGGRGEVETLAIDVADPANAPAIAERALARFGRIDVLVNNAGAVSAGPLAAQSNHELAMQFGTHAIGPIAIVRESLRALQERGGHVFMLGSGVARVPVGGLGAYPAAKAATRSATSTLRLELKPLGVRVTYVDPGAVDTPFMARAGMPGAPAAMLAAPDRVARAVMRAIGTNARDVNAVPWQTSAVALAERFPRVTDFFLARMPELVGGASTAPLPASASGTATAADHGVVLLPANDAVITADTIVQTDAIATIAPLAPDAPVAEPPPLERALEPVARRMERLKLTRETVAGWLVRGATLDGNDVAMRWAGMPNKNERALVDDVLQALSDAGFVAATDDARFTVEREA